MESRTQKLLNSIIREYVKTAEPVGSSLLVEKYGLDISSATVRNEMAALEEAGYIAQPHTSAGRVPTARGYQFYVDNFLNEKKINAKVEDSFAAIIKKHKKDRELLLKNLAKFMAEASGAAVVVGFGPMNVYYTGIANIFSQPEFAEANLIYNLSLVIDHLDEVMQRIFREVKDTRILIGEKNPFDARCASILSDYKLGRESGIFGFLGPMRMDYDFNLGLIKHAKNLINQI